MFLKFKGTEKALSRGLTRVKREGSAGLRPLVALDDHEIRRRDRRAQLHRLLVFGRTPAVERGLVARELDHGVAAATRALDRLVRAGAREELRAELLERRVVRRDVFLVLLRVADVDADDPVALGHHSLRFRIPIVSVAAESGSPPPR